MTDGLNFTPPTGIDFTSNSPEGSAPEATPINGQAQAGQTDVLAIARREAQIARARMLNQFYTPPETAQLCIDTFFDVVKPQRKDRFLDPAAGAGAFFDKLSPSKRIGLDIDPAARYVKKADFLGWRPKMPKSRRILTIGNPPFSHAKAFIAHAAEFSAYIGFILPPAILKPSQLNQLPPSLHVVHKLDLINIPFTLCDEPHAITCVFVIFEKRDVPRAAVAKPTTHPDFAFVPTAAEADFAVRRVGGHAGKVIDTQGTEPGARGLSAQSNYFIKARTLPADVLFQRFKAIDFHAVAKPSVGPASLSKGEIIETYDAAHGWMTQQD